MASEHRNMVYQNKKQETTEIAPLGDQTEPVRTNELRARDDRPREMGMVSGAGVRIRNRSDWCTDERNCNTYCMAWPGRGESSHRTGGASTTEGPPPPPQTPPLPPHHRLPPPPLFQNTP
ncbi:hypothetical protein AAG570_000183 [Ranatra chinensis]|uniref:Uncharacterized protein n=1 Tax=Ranatra chinensis TaxID=642074 RepID=A0ABD0YWC1_9HEMI